MKITRDKTVYALSKDNTPVCTVKAPCHLTFETCDCFMGQVTSETQRLESLDFNRVNPATGPVFVEGALPGDALAVHIKAIRTADTGVLMTAPGAGFLPKGVQGKVAICPLADGHFTFQGVQLPLSPMIGVIGVAPAGEAVSCGTPGVHGGNMDTTSIREGSLLYLPVLVEGALLAMGDLHAAMGDGEVCVTGLEVAGEVDVCLTVEKGMHLPCPLVKSATELAFLASGATIDAALNLSVQYMNDFLVRHTTLDADDALMLMSACGQARISQVVDPLMTARFCMDREVLRRFGVPLAF